MQLFLEEGESLYPYCLRALLINSIRKRLIRECIALLSSCLISACVMLRTVNRLATFTQGRVKVDQIRESH